MNCFRLKQIQDGMANIRIGDLRSDIEQRIGTPDELKFLYPSSGVKSVNNQAAGYTCWYVIKRDAKAGSVNDKHEDLLRLTYHHSGVLLKLHAWGEKAENLKASMPAK